MLEGWTMSVVFGGWTMLTLLEGWSMSVVFVTMSVTIQ